MDGKSIDVIQEQKEKLKKLFPEAFSEGRVDWEKLKATLGEDIAFNNERYVLNWAGKSEAFRVLQSPTTASLIPVEEESIRFDESSNLFIEGENLEVLKTLQRSYHNKVKMIYIDPPYNTGGDSFIYPDKFSEKKAEYLKRIGSKDENGYLTKEGLFKKNSKDSGHYHSNWLSMMYPRLFLARNLLKEDGVIFVSIDDNEIHNLRLLMNEIFGEESFIAVFIWKRRQNVDSRSKTGASVDHEYLLCYGRGPETSLRGAQKDVSKYKNPDNDLRGDWMSADMTGLATKDQRPNLHYNLKDPNTGIVYECPPTGWRYEPKTMNRLVESDEVIFPPKPNGRPRRKKFFKDLESEFTGQSTVLKTVYNTQGTRELRTIFDGKELLEFPKPKDFLKIPISQGTNKDKEDIVLDFFAGSSTVAHTVMEQNKEDGGNRRFICVQLPEETPEKSEAHKAGYRTIAEIGKERIRRVIGSLEKEKKAKPDLFKPKNGELDLGFKVFKLRQSNFKAWKSNIENGEELLKQVSAFEDPVKPGSEAENMVYELILKSGRSLTSKIEKKSHGKIPYYVINDNDMILALAGISLELVKEIIKQKPQKIIALDKLFKGDDQLKTNTVLQMKDAGIDFKTI